MKVPTSDTTSAMSRRRKIGVRSGRQTLAVAGFAAIASGYRRAARIKPTPSVSTAPARNTAPTYARDIRPFGSVAVGDTTERKNAAGIRIAAIGAPIRASHFQNGDSAA